MSYLTVNYTRKVSIENEGPSKVEAKIGETVDKTCRDMYHRADTGETVTCLFNRVRIVMYREKDHLSYNSYITPDEIGGK